MGKNYSKIKYELMVFGILCLTHNLWKFFMAKYSTKQGVTFVTECLLGIGPIFLPDLANKFLRTIMPLTIIYSYWFFLFISVLLGTPLHMVSIISFWDKILCFVNPMLLAVVGYGIVGFLLKKIEYAGISPQLFSLSGFTFAGLYGVSWEFWEFICDSLGNINLQHCNMPSGQPLTRRAAPMDTVEDLFISTLRAFVMGVYIYIGSKGNPEHLEDYAIKGK